MEFIPLDWPAPRHVRAGTTTRGGGVSRGVYASLNLGDHVGDDPEAVQRNRALVRAALALPNEPRWLTQVHGTTIVDAAAADPGTRADGSIAAARGIVCAVLSADCLPIFLCDRAGTRVALLHAGWRGLAHGVIDAGVRAMQVPAHELMAGLGPAISGAAYQVGAEVRAAFVGDDAGAAIAFVHVGADKWRADLYRLARRRLEAAGVGEIYGGGYCTAHTPEKFFSYRRDGVTGRMASLIWLA